MHRQYQPVHESTPVVFVSEPYQREIKPTAQHGNPTYSVFLINVERIIDISPSVASHTVDGHPEYRWGPYVV